MGDASHYRRGDPETGCFLMLIGIVVLVLIIVAVVVLVLAPH